jgi:proton glutamate symport protein
MKTIFARISFQKKRISLTAWIFIGVFFGIFAGAFSPGLTALLHPFQNLFLHGVKCVIAPLIFATVVTGVSSAGGFKQLGLMGARTFLYFEVITTLALVVGLLVVNVIQPGVGVSLDGSKAGSLDVFTGSKLSFSGFIDHLLPVNFADAVVRGDVLQIVIFSTLFGLAALAIGEKSKPILQFSESLAQVMFKFVSYIMLLAPLGVCASVAAAVSENGWEVMVPLLKLVLTLYLALFLFVALVFLPVCKLFKIPMREFFTKVKDPVLWAFATTSSESAYPLALERLEQFGVPRRISSFVLPMGYSFNLDGSTLYLSLASVFIAQVAGIHLAWEQQLLIMFTLMLTSKGVAAVPRTSIVVLSGTLSQFGLPLEGLALILAVDAFMDMGRSAINLLGNCLATAVIARSEGIELGDSAVVVPKESLFALEAE